MSSSSWRTHVRRIRIRSEISLEEIDQLLFLTGCVITLDEVHNFDCEHSVFQTVLDFGEVERLNGNRNVSVKL